MKEILVPVDFSDATAPVLEVVGRLTRELGSSVTLLHVVEPIATSVPVGASMDVLSTTPIETVQDPDVFRGRMEKLAAPLRSSGIPIQCECIPGLAADDIVATAREKKADMIVMGSHGHGALYHLFAGSVSTATLKHAPCPVLFVPIQKKS